jgi:hypothetical protein
MKLYSREFMRAANVGKVKRVRIFNGGAKEVLSGVAPLRYEEAFEVGTETWMGSAARENVLREMRGFMERVRQYNVAGGTNGFDERTLDELVTRMQIDLLRQGDDLVDYTPLLFTERKDENVTEIANLLDYLPWVGKESVIDGSGDNVPLIQHKLPAQYTVNMEIRGFGDTVKFRELVFNPFYKTENIITSAARILADAKNHDAFGPIVGATYTTPFLQTKETSGASVDINMYLTIKKAIVKALSLYCLPIGKPNGTLKCEVFLLINPLDRLRIEPVVNGNLAQAGGLQQYAGALPLDGIIPYAGGLNDGMKYGKETLSFPGVPQNSAFVFVKVDTYSGYRIVKQDETMEMAPGDIMSLTNEKRVWYRIRGVHSDFVTPKTEGGKNYGAVVKVELPDD